MNRYKKIIVTLSLFCIALMVVEISLLKTMFLVKSLPETGVISDKEAAIKYAEAIWLPIYGGMIYNELPRLAFYDRDTDQWYVRGTLPEGWFGGFPEIWFNGTDARTLRVVHYK